jgi:putative transcription antitermination factor YqgF
MKYLGIDYGKSKFGTAFSEGELVTPGKVVQISGLQDAITKIIQIIEAEEVEIVVIGMPESGEARKITEKFIAAAKNGKLKDEVKIIPVEETLSSQNARETLIQLGVSQKKRAQEDAYAAAEILQGYLDFIAYSK